MRGIDESTPTTARRALLHGVGIVVAFIVAQTVLGAIVFNATGALDGTASLSKLTTKLGIALCIIQSALAVIALWWISRRDWVRAAGLRAPVRDHLLGLRALLPVGLLVVLPGILIAIDAGNAIDSTLTLDRGIVLVLLAILIGVNEELWFRGLLFASLARTGRVYFVVLVSALLFGLPHVSDEPASWLNAAAVTLAIGIPFAAVRVRRRALGPMIVWHSIVDIWAFVHTARITVSGTPTLAEAIGGLILPAALAGGYLLWMQRGIRTGDVTQ